MGEDENYAGNVVVERMYKMLYQKYSEVFSYALREVQRVTKYGKNADEMKKELERVSNVEKLVREETLVVIRTLEECLGINSIFAKREH